MKPMHKIGKNLLRTVPFMKFGSAAICLAGTTMEAYVAWLRLQKVKESLNTETTKGKK